MLPMGVYSDAFDDVDGAAFAGYFDITSVESASSAQEAVSGTAAVASSATGISSIFGGTAAFDAYILAILLNSPCASPTDRSRINVMMYIVAPFKDYDEAGMILGNLGLLVLFVAVHLAIANVLQRTMHLTTLEVFAKVYFPSLPYIASELAYPGIAIGTFSLVHKVDNALDIVSIILGFIALVGLPALVLLTLVKVSSPRYHDYAQFNDRPFFHRLFLPQNFIRDSDQSRACSRHLAPFASQSKAFFGVYTMATIALSAFIMYLLPDSVACTVKLWLLFGFLSIVTICLAVRRPYRFHFETVCICFSLALLAILSLLMALQNNSNSSVLDNAQTAVVLVLVASIVIRVIINLAVMFLEYKLWKPLQAQIVAEADANDDLASRKSAFEEVTKEEDGYFDINVPQVALENDESIVLTPPPEKGSDDEPEDDGPIVPDRVVCDFLPAPEADVPDNSSFSSDHNKKPQTYTSASESSKSSAESLFY
eukprot:GILI01004580.1.p1 GENE.GILI01004580.1~~GILI01004580.1.p1  ORF type:complete len:483 (+),score=73.70 GILI01004580.1:127-1575(+)